MGKESRRGSRKDRKKRMASRKPELGYYLVVTDTKETEKNYFEGIRNTIPDELKSKLVIKVERAATVDLVERAIELRNEDPQYRIPWIVFDRDQVKNFDRIIEIQKNQVYVQAGLIHVLKFGFIHIFRVFPILIIRCHAVKTLEKTMKKLLGLNIPSQTQIYMKNL